MAHETPPHASDGLGQDAKPPVAPDPTRSDDSGTDHGSKILRLGSNAKGTYTRSPGKRGAAQNGKTRDAPTGGCHHPHPFPPVQTAKPEPPERSKTRHARKSNPPIWHDPTRPKYDLTKNSKNHLILSDTPDPNYWLAGYMTRIRGDSILKTPNRMGAVPIPTSPQ